MKGVVVFPPGWSLDVAGPHLALPMLRGFAAARNVALETLDLNIAVASHFQARIPGAAAAAARLDTGDLSSLYFRAQGQLDEAARAFGGVWSIRNGYLPAGLSPERSHDVYQASRDELPYSGFLRRTTIPRLLGADLVGLSVAVPGQLIGAFHIANLLREEGYGGKIVLGGNAVTRLGTALCKDWVFDCVDGVVLYGGEVALAAMLSSPELCPSRVPNLIWRSGDHFVTNPLRHLTPAEFVTPRYDEVEPSEYWGLPHLPAVAFRGCYFGRCPFCAIPFAWGPAGQLGMDSAENVLKSIRQGISATGINRFKFVDESIHPRFVKRFVGLLESGGDELEFEAYARLDPLVVDESLMQRAARGGLRKLYIGLEVAAGGNRSQLAKNDSADVATALRVLSSAGIRVHLFCMIGYPGTTSDDAWRTVEFLLSHRSMIDTVDVARFRLEKHTLVQGVRRKPVAECDWALADPFEPTSSSSMTEEEAEDLCVDIEDLLWHEEPTWLHPVVRLVSPWMSREPSMNTTRCA